MKSLLKIVAFLALCGCTIPNDTNSFESIDYSSYWGYYHSIKILNNGKAYFYYDYDHPTRKLYFSLTLDQTQLDSINNLLKTLYTIKIDSTYFLIRDSGRDFGLIIKSKNRRLATLYSGPYSGVTGLSPLFKFVDYIIGLSHKIESSADSSFVFESKQKLFLLHPPTPDLN